MRLLFTLVFISLLTLSCNSSESNQSNGAAQNNSQYDMSLNGDGSFEVTGTISNAAGKEVYLQSYPVFTAGRNQEVNMQDTATIGEDGSFTLKGDVDHKTFGLVALDNQRAAYLVLDGSDYTLNADFNDFQNYKINGNAEAKLIKQFFSILRSHYNSLNSARSDLRVARGNQESEERIQELADKEFNAMDGYFTFIKTFADTTSSPLISMFTAGMLEPSLYGEFYNELVERYEGMASTSPYFERLKKRASGGGKLIGSEAPAIRLPDPQGDTMALSDLRGNYVLLDFWAAWCKPCRRENPNLVRLYDEYKDENFKIFSVSLDRNKQDWTKAIKADNLYWDTHVSELAFWNTEAIKPYGVNSIPATYLINPDGEIIAKNLRGFTLEKKLKQLFGEE